MTDQKKHSNLFLHADYLQEAVELMFFAYRDFTSCADQILANYDMGRAHHRVIHFVDRQPGLTVSQLLSTLKITKQSLSRVLSFLTDKGFVSLKINESDKRKRELRLTEKGQALQNELTQAQQELFLSAYEQADATAVDGFRQIMLCLIKDSEDRQRFDLALKDLNMPLDTSRLDKEA